MNHLSSNKQPDSSFNCRAESFIRAAVIETTAMAPVADPSSTQLLCESSYINAGPGFAPLFFSSFLPNMTLLHPK